MGNSGIIFYYNTVGIPHYSHLTINNALQQRGNMENNKAYDILDKMDDLVAILSLLPGLKIIPYTHLTVKLGIKYLIQKGVFKENKDKMIQADFVNVMTKVFEETSNLIYSCEYKDFLTNSYLRLKEKLEEKKYNNHIGFDDLTIFLKQCMKESIKIELYEITMLDINNFIDSIYVVFAKELYRYPEYGTYLNCINVLDIRNKLKYLEEEVRKLENNISNLLRNNELKKIQLPHMIRGINQPVGREDDIKILERMLESKRPVVLVHAMGGVGKTELCKYYCINSTEKVGWFDFDNDLKTTLLICGDVDKMTNDESREKEYNRIRNYILSLPNENILVFDNIGNLQQEDFDFLCKINCKVLLTSREEFPAHSHIFEHYFLDLLDNMQCRDLFEYYLSHKREQFEYEDINILDSIIELAGNHTLTIELLAKTYDTSFKINSFKDLFDLLKEKGFDIKNKVYINGKIEKKEFNKHMLMLFDISNIKDKKKVDILKNICLLPPIPIKGNKIICWLGLSEEGSLQWLARTGWIKNTNGYIVMHKTICETLKSSLRPHYKECKKLITSLTKENQFAETDIRIFDPPYLRFGYDVSMYFLRIRSKTIVLSNLLYIVGYILSKQSNYNKAIEFLEYCLIIRKGKYDINNPSVIEAKKILAETYRENCNYAKATELYNDIINASEKYLYYISDAYNDLGIISKKLDDYEKAEIFYTKAITAHSGILQVEDINTASFYNNLAFVYKKNEEYDKALELLEKDLSICKRLLDKDHPNIYITYNNIAGIYELKGDYIEALNIYKRVKDFRVRVLGNRHKSTAIIYNNIGYIYYMMALKNNENKYYNNAKKNYMMSLDIINKIIFGPNDVTEAIHSNLWKLYDKMNNTEMKNYHKNISEDMLKSMNK